MRPWAAKVLRKVELSTLPPPVSWLTMLWLLVRFLTDSLKKLSVVPSASGRLSPSFWRST